MSVFPPPPKKIPKRCALDFYVNLERKGRGEEAKEEEEEEEGKEQRIGRRVQTLIEQMGFMKITAARINSG